MIKRSIPYLDDLRAFEATARLGSVRAAGDELALTHAAVSRRVKRLSEGIGTPLFERHGRGLRLTAAGERMHDTCRRTFEDLRQTVDAIQAARRPENPAVLLSCERSVAMRWLIPRLSRFQDANPDVIVHLSVGGGAVETDEERITVALRRLDFPVPPGWTVTPLFKETMGPVMTADLQADYQAGRFVSLGSKTRPDAWERWLDAHPSAPCPLERRMMDHHFLMVEAACSGLGVALCPRVLALDDIERGRLVAPHGFDPDGSEYGLLHPSGADLPSGAARLVDWLIATSAGV